MMRHGGGSRLGLLCDGILEASWLGAAVCLPLAMVPDVEHNFTPFKCVWIGIFASVTAAAWGLRAVDGLREDRRDSRSVAGLLPTLFFLCVAVSCALSIDPATSALGSQMYILGGLETVSLGVLFASVAVHLRRWEQAERLVGALLAPLGAMSLYALYQRFGLDRTGFVMDPAERAFSFAGHPIFLGGWILLCLPLLVWRLAAFRWLRGKETAWLIFYGLLAAAAGAAFLFTGSRGPVIALLAGGCFAGVLAGAYAGKRWITIAVCSAVVLGIAGLAGLALAHGGGIKKNLLVERFAATLPIREGGDAFRTTLWNSAPAAFSGHVPSRADGRPDSLASWRMLVGFGPATSDQIGPQHWTFGGADARPEGTYHNFVWDMLMGTGVLGFASFLGFFLLIFHRGYAKLCLPGGGISFWKFALASFGVASLAGAGAALTFGPGFSAIGFQFGILATLAGFPLFGRPPATEAARSEPTRDGLLIAVLVALAAHWIEAGFAYESPITGTLFWILAGAGWALSSPSFAESAPKPAGMRLASIFPAAMGTLVAMFLLQAFLRKFSAGEFGPLQALGACLVRESGSGPLSLLLPAVIIPGIVAGVGVAWLPTLGWKNPLRHLSVGLLAAFALGVCYALLRAWQLAGMGAVPGDLVSEAAVVGQFRRFEFLVASSYALAAGVVLVLGVFLPGSTGQANLPAGRFALACVLPAALAAAWACSIFFSRVASPEMAFSYGLVLVEKGDARNALPILARSVAMNPRIEHRAVEFSSLLEQLALRSGETPQAEGFLREARRTLDGAIRVNTLSRLHDEKGKFLIRQASRSAETGERNALAWEALEEMRQATTYWPGFEAPWAHKAFIEGELLGDPQSAKNSLAKADTLGASCPANWADHYFGESVQAQTENLRDFYGRRALHYYDQALSPPPQDSAEHARLRTARGTALRNRGDTTGALAEFLEAIRVAADAPTWQAEAMAATCYHDLGQDSEARRLLLKAMLSAPQDMLPALREIESSLR